MAEMPGKARSVGDPIGDGVEVAGRRERLKREHAEDVAALARSQRLAALRLPFEQRSADLDLTPRLRQTLAIGDKTYREVDNGAAGVLVPVDDPLVTPAVRAERRRAIERAFFVAGHPIGGPSTARRRSLAFRKRPAIRCLSEQLLWTRLPEASRLEAARYPPQGPVHRDSCLDSRLTPGRSGTAD